jgi:tetratricopeptide (TPR) repeat protein
MKYIFLFCFSMLTLLSVAQNSEKAMDVYTKGRSLMEEEEFSKAIESFKKGIKIEESFPNIDSNFLAKLYLNVGLTQFKLKQVFTGFDHYFKAFSLFPDSGKAKWILLSDAYNYYDLIHESTDYQAYIPDYDHVEKIFFRIDTVYGRSNDTVWVGVDGGLVHGLFKGSYGGALSIDTKDNRERGNNDLGYAEIIEIGPFHSIIQIELYEPENPEMDIIKGDNVQLRAKRDIDRYVGTLQEFSDLSIFFMDLYEAPFYNKLELLHYDSPELENIIFELMVKDIIDGGYELESFEDKPESWTAATVGGKFDGLSILQFMQQATKFDLLMFFNYINTYPSNYMEKTWKITETFATWGINETPLGDQRYVVPMVLDQYKKQPTEEFHKFFNQNRFYFDDSLMVFLRPDIIGNESESESDKIAGNLEMNLLISEWAGDMNLKYNTLLDKSLLYYYEANYLKAIDYATRAIRLDSNGFGGYWQRSNFYADEEKFELAIRDLIKISEMYPDYASAYGNAGWYYILDGDVENAVTYINKAYQLDSFEMAWVVNLGHVYMLKGDTAKARKYYRQTLELIDSMPEYIAGPKADFEIFIEKGWNTDVVQSLKQWMQDLVDRFYANRWYAEEYYYKGKALKDNDDYAKAAEAFVKSAEYEQNAEIPRYDWLHYSTTWSGWSYQMDGKQLNKALDYYLLSLDIAQNHLNDEDVADDYGLLGWIQKDLENKAKSDAYYEMQTAINRKLEDQKLNNDLFVVSIGIDQYDDIIFEYAAKDAKDVGELLASKSKALFDTTYTFILTNEKADKKGIEDVFNLIARKSKPGDTFVLFFAGKSHKEKLSSDYYLMPYGVSKSTNPDFSNGDDLSKLINWDKFTGYMDSVAIPGKLIKTWLNSMQADNQLLLIDAAATSFIKTYLRSFTIESDESDIPEKDILIFSPSGARIEKTNLQHSVLTQAVLNALMGNANVGNPSDTMITAKELDAYLFKYLGNYTNYYKNQNYSNGMDFKLASADKQEFTGEDTMAPVIIIQEPQLTRGGSVETDKNFILIKGQVVDLSGLQYIKVNGKGISFKQNGKFNTGLSLQIGKNEIIIESEDVKGNHSEDQLIINRTANKRNRPEFTFGIKEGMNYALIFGSDKYVEWSDLSNPLRDAHTIADELYTNFGFDSVRVIENATKNEIRAVIKRYQKKNYGENDRLFIFFAGHGMYDETSGAGYIVASDSKKNDEYFDTYIDYSYLRDHVKNINVNHIFLCLDVCFGGSFVDQSFSGRGDEIDKKQIDVLYNESLKRKTRLYLTSGGKEYVPDGRPNSHSPFAAKLLEALRVQALEKGYLSFRGLIGNMETLKKSTPTYGEFGNSEPGANFIFIFQPLTRESDVAQKQGNI